ncbi:glycoside hydrolase family 114 protein, partial [Piromyces sp. E2]
LTFLFILIITNGAEALWKPKPGTTWNIILGHGFDISKEKAEAIVIDLHSNSAEDIKKYHDAGKKVLCYFSGGTIEDFRPDKDDYYKVDGLVKNEYKQWKGENWLDFRKEGIKPLITNRIKLAVEKKCDAVDVDNLDGCQDKSVLKWSNPLTKEDTIKFAKWLAATAHELGISISLKNSLFMIDEVGDDFDMAINESCVTHEKPECHHYKKFIDSGKAVFGITY